MAVKDDAKQALRIKTSAFDGEIESLIDAARINMKLSGIKAEKADGDDPLIHQAIILYCKALFGLGNPDKEKYWASYQAMVCQMALSSDYGVRGGDQP